MNKVWLARAGGLMFCGVLAGCAGTGFGSSGTGPVYRCEHGIAFTVKFADNTAVLSGARTPNGSSGAADQDVLLRDAGGQGAGQAFYSNPRMRAEFGLGASGREAILRYPLLPLVARCARE
jgi:hypothetical protein